MTRRRATAAPRPVTTRERRVSRCHRSLLARRLNSEALPRVHAHPAPRFSRAFTGRRTRRASALRPGTPRRMQSAASRARRSTPSWPGTNSVPTRAGRPEYVLPNEAQPAAALVRLGCDQAAPSLRRQTDRTHHRAAIQNSCSGRRQARGVARRPPIINSSRAARTLAGNIATRSAIRP